MTTPREALALAVDCQRRGQWEDAAGIYRLILAAHPDNAPALNNLGLLVPPEEAVGLFQRAVAAQPDYVDALANLAKAHQARGDAVAAIPAYEQAIALAPGDAELLFRLGYLRHRQGDIIGAVAQYELALAIMPDFVPALSNLGAAHVQSGRYGPAVDCYRRALTVEPGLTAVHIGMAGILVSAGRLTEARAFHARVPRPQALLIETAPTPRRTVLILASSNRGNVPLDALLPAVSTTTIVWQVEYATDEQAAQLPPHDVAFNAIGNADVMDQSFEQVSRFHARHPVLNPPDAVAPTRRDRLPRLLGGIPGIVVPPVVRLARNEVGQANLAAAGINYPVLVRPIVGHGGEGVSIAATPADLAAMALPDADAFYVSAYHDYSSPDGHYRKYRMIYVDRQPYAYHLAISLTWLVHYFSADMLAAPWKRQEEQRFLEDPAGVLGLAAMTAITAIGRRLDLDFAGIDFAILPDGRVLVFEANATMLVHLRDSPEDFAYKHAHVPAIFAAFDIMLDRHTLSRPPPGPAIPCPAARMTATCHAGPAPASG